jgi:phage shock protein PspC (stress-responsive transcriptional regulator)
MTDQTPPHDDEPTTPPGSEEPTTEQPPAAQAPPSSSHGGADGGPRRLYRSRSDRVIGGVCGGVARHFDIDPVIVRVVAVALVLVGGAGVILYLAALLLVPDEDAAGGPADPPRRGVAIAGVVLLVIAVAVLLPFHGGWWGGGTFVLGLIALAGLVVWRMATGERLPGDASSVLRAVLVGVALLLLCGALAIAAAWAVADGGGEVVAGAIVAIGLALVAGAFLDRRARWLIVPAMAIALPAGVVSAADIDISGGVGERTYRPVEAATIRPSYHLGMGRLVVDLRGADLPPGDRPLKVKVGVGEALVIVDRDVCVTSNAHLGAGGVSVFDRDSGGIDVDWQDDRTAPARNARVVLDGDVGVGALLVRHTDDDGHDFRRGIDQINTGCL